MLIILVIVLALALAVILLVEFKTSKDNARKLKEAESVQGVTCQYLYCWTEWWPLPPKHRCEIRSCSGGGGGTVQ